MDYPEHVHVFRYSQKYVYLSQKS